MLHTKNVIAIMLNNTFCSILKVVEKKPKSGEEPDMKKKKGTDTPAEYAVQYYNKFKKLWYRKNKLTYHVFQDEIVTYLCPPI